MSHCHYLFRCRIGWAHDKDRTMLVDDYEAARPPRKHLPQLVLTRQDREEILIEWGASFNEIIDSIRANVKAKNQRRRTVSSLDRYDRFEEYMESASRRLKRTLLLKKTTRRQAEEMADQSTRYSRVTYIDRPPQQPQQQRLIDVAPRQPPRAPESPMMPLHTTLHHDETLDSLHEIREHNGEHHVIMDGMMEEQAPCHLQLDGRAAPVVDFDALDDDSMYFDQYMPVRFIGGSNDIPPQYHQQMQFQTISPESQQYYLQQLYEQQQQQQQQQQWRQKNEHDAISAVMEDLTYDGEDTDGIESLSQSYWGDDGMDAPGIRRLMGAVIISEDGQYEADDGWDNGFTLQPPPHSNSIISSWE
ncbi:hypothetical protein MPSEU_000281500 [Mayamaea pseudoterrestris]|nr:hypothetical protein MPSEU_000281500 [Mayamaea pseudoterrestris]